MFGYNNIYFSHNTINKNWLRESYLLLWRCLDKLSSKIKKMFWFNTNTNRVITISIHSARTHFQNDFVIGNSNSLIEYNKKIHNIFNIRSNVSTSRSTVLYKRAFSSKWRFQIIQSVTVYAFSNPKKKILVYILHAFMKLNN